MITARPDPAPTAARGKSAEAPLDFPWPAPEPGSPPRELVPGILWMRQPLASRLNHVNQWILDDPVGATVVDAGVDTPEARAGWAGALGNRAVARVLVTHHHYDHVGGAGYLCETFGAPLWMTRTEWMAALARTRSWTDGQRRLRRLHFDRNGMPAGDAARIEAHFEAFSAKLPPVPGAFRRLIAGQTLTIGGRGWEVLTGEGHAPEQAMLFSAADRILIAADQVLPGITPHIGVWADEPEADPLGLFLATLDRLSALPEDTLVLPSHGLPFRRLHDRLEAIRRHHDRRLDQTAEACRAPRTGTEIMGVLFRPPRDIQDVALGFSEALAHLHCLRERGVLTVAEDASGLRRFRMA